CTEDRLASTAVSRPGGRGVDMVSRTMKRSAGVTEASFDHVFRLTDRWGMFEHADGITPRRDGGYCLDDVARALVVVCRQRPATSTLYRLSAHALTSVY